MNARYLDEEMRVIRVSELQKILGLSKSTIYERINPASRWFDPDFPAPFKIGGYAVGWDSRDVRNFIDLKKQAGRNEF